MQTAAVGGQLGYEHQRISDIPVNTAKSRTISSAIGRIDDLNGRLRDLNGRLQGIADLIGGPRPVSCTSGEKLPDACGVVGHLNDSAECAHVQVSDLEELIAAIGRALG